MKTLVVLSALCSIALAAPALQGEPADNTDHTPAWHHGSSLPELATREKMATSEMSTGAVLHNDASNIEVHNDASGRSLGLKKSLIVKKKHGIRMYRDSEEEKAHADSHESCGRQVRVKLCDEDGKFSKMLRSSGHDFTNFHTADDDMKLSIKMAKEAVENLQRDLMKIENNNPSMKMAHDSESDNDLHQDIEVARQALEHIHSNFDNVDTMSLHATASSESEAMHAHITLAKSEEEKMAQWKEAMETIKKNVEIARNIEDSFKAAHEQDSLLHLDQIESASSKLGHGMEEIIASHEALDEEHQMRGAETKPLGLNLLGKDNKDEDLIDKVNDNHMNENHATETKNAEIDMHSSASEPVQMKTVAIDNHHTLKSENHQRHAHEMKSNGEIEEHNQITLEKVEHNQEHHQLEKSSELELNPTSLDTAQHQKQLFIKDDEEKSSLDMKKEAWLKTSEKEADTQMVPAIDLMKAVTDADMSNEHQSNEELTNMNEKPEHQMHHENTLDGNDHLTGPHAKSAEVCNDVHEDKTHKESKPEKENARSAEKTKSELEDHLESFEMNPKEASQSSHKQSGEDKMHKESKPEKENARSAEKMKPELEDHFESFEINAKDASQSSHEQSGEEKMEDHMSKSAQDIQLQKLRNIAEHTQNFMKAATQNIEEQNKYMNIDSNESDHDTPKIEHHHPSTMKAVENKHFLEHLPTHGHWDHGHKASIKTVEDMKTGFHGRDHLRNSHPTGQHLGMTHDFDMPEHAHHHHHAHIPSRYHHNLMSHSNMHDMNDMPGGAMASNFHPSMREAMDSFGSERTFQWKPTHESARNAYGAGLTGPGIGGAVGVFPNANAGGCGIPLLLSCSPSVVSGSLAKAHSGPGYASPSYRTEDDFAFHNKRDIKKTNEIRSTNVLRTPSIAKHKTNILEKETLM